MWPRECVDFYVHEEFEMPPRFSSDDMLGVAYRMVPRSAPLGDLEAYVEKLARFPDIVIRVTNKTGVRWFVLPLASLRDFKDMILQIVPPIGAKTFSC